MEMNTPDPYATADAQQSLNTRAAVNQNLVNQTNQVTPDYTLTYKPSGTMQLDGGNIIPRYTAYTELTPEQQKIHDINVGTKTTLANIGNEQSAAVRNILNKPFDMNDAGESKYEQMLRTRLDPQWATKRQQFETDLINRGIRPGSEGYNTMMGNFGQQENDAYNQMYVTGKGLFNQEALTERNQPINEIIGLLNGTQVQQPNFINTPQSTLQPADLQGAVYKSAQMENQQKAATMGGLFGLGGSMLGMATQPLSLFGTKIW